MSSQEFTVVCWRVAQKTVSNPCWPISLSLTACQLLYLGPPICYNDTYEMTKGMIDMSTWYINSLNIWYFCYIERKININITTIAHVHQKQNKIK